MNGKFELVIFDLGETLLHFAGDFFAVNEEGVRRMHSFLDAQGITLDFEQLLKIWTEERKKGFIRAEETMREVTADSTLVRVMNHFGIDNIAPDIVTRAVDIFFEPEINEYELFSDALDTLSQLKREGYRIGLISNATCDRLIRKMVSMFGLDEYLDLVYSSAGIGIRKPHPDIFRSMLEEFGVEPEKAVMVGDSPYHDIYGAHTAGMTGILVHNELQGGVPEYRPDFTAKELIDVLEFVR